MASELDHLVWRKCARVVDPCPFSRKRRLTVSYVDFAKPVCAEASKICYLQLRAIQHFICWDISVVTTPENVSFSGFLKAYSTPRTVFVTFIIEFATVTASSTTRSVDIIQPPFLLLAMPFIILVSAFAYFLLLQTLVRFSTRLATAQMDFPPNGSLRRNLFPCMTWPKFYSANHSIVEVYWKKMGARSPPSGSSKHPDRNHDPCLPSLTTWSFQINIGK